MNSTRVCETDIRANILKEGKITFAQFMELALFHPQDGYYTVGRKIGADGDYFTSSTAHPSFGALIAIQVEQMWQLLRSPSSFYLIELGASEGLLAKDILRYAHVVSTSFEKALHYVAVDRCRVASKDAHFQPMLADRVPFRNVVGCFLSNELLDAFPVHRFTIQDSLLKELYVTLDSDKLVEAVDTPSTPFLQQRLDALGISLPEGFRGEINLGIDPWIQAVAQSLDRGFVLTIDYGYTTQELYSQQRSKGTLQCYYMHTQSGNPYVHIGRQDITAHVDFSSVMQAGKTNGLETQGFVTQRDFLNNLGMQTFMKALRRKGLPQREYYANRMGMQELVQSKGLGNFKVLVQSKGLPIGLNLHGLTPDNEQAQQIEADMSNLDVPLLAREHTPLMEGRYPHQSWEQPFTLQ